MTETEELLAAIRTALDPRRFMSALSDAQQGRAFLQGEVDAVTRAFLNSEAAVAIRGPEALDALEGQLRGVDAVLAEVHRANMSKLDRDGRPALRGGNVQKGDGLRPPDIAAVRARQGLA